MTWTNENEESEPEPEVMDLADALQYYVDEGHAPEGFVIRYTYGEPAVNSEAHPLWERLKLVAAGNDLHLHRRVLLFKEKSFTQYEMTWQGHHKLLVETTNQTCELVENISKDMKLRPTFTFGFIGSNPPPLEDETVAPEDDVF